jgi:hypothetical protein
MTRDFAVTLVADLAVALTIFPDYIEVESSNRQTTASCLCSLRRDQYRWLILREGVMSKQNSAEQTSNVREALEGLDQSRRETLTKLIRGSAFVAPVVVAFAMEGLTVGSAEAQAGSSSRGGNITVPSDRRLKRDVARVGTHPMGFGIYRFKYLWSDAAYTGVLAQEVLDKAPHAVMEGPGGFLGVNYQALGMEMTRGPRLAS